MFIDVCRNQENIILVEKGAGILKFNQKPDRFVDVPYFELETGSQRKESLCVRLNRSKGIREPLVARSLLKG